MTDTLQIDLTRIPHLEARRRIVALWEAYGRAEAERNAAAKPFWDKRRDLDKVVDARVAAIRAEHTAEYEVIDKEMQAVEKPFEEKTSVLWNQIDDASGHDLIWWDDYSGFERCVLSGLPLLGNDDLWESDVGEKILAVLVERGKAAVPEEESTG